MQFSWIAPRDAGRRAPVTGSHIEESAPGAALLPWLFPAMLALLALDVLLSGRDLNQSFAQLQRSAEAAAPLLERGPLQVWAQRAVSLLVIVATLQRIAAHAIGGRPAPAPLLTVAFLVYWAGSIAAPGLLAAHPRVSHEYLYPLLLGLACTLVEPRDHERMLVHLRNALFVSMLAGLPVLLVQPGLVLDSTYDQGLLGLPRYGGLATSPVSMGLLAQVALLVLWAEPFRRRWLTRAAGVLGLAILLFAQSKTAWLALLAGAACMWMVKASAAGPYGLGHPRRSATAISLCAGFMLFVLAALVGALAFDLPALLEGFLSTPEGAQLASLTGRDRIWIVALEEWRGHPVFGYGLPMWDSAYRQEVGLPQATHAHNQMVDTLGRSGLVGAAGLVVYAAVLLGLSVRFARAGNGLGLAMGVTLLLLSVSEVPLLLVDYGAHLLHHYLLLVSLAAAAAYRTAPAAKRAAVCAPVLLPPRRARRTWPLRTLGVPAMGLLVTATPVLLVAGTPLAEGLPRGTAAAAPKAVVLGTGAPMRLKLERGLRVLPLPPLAVAAKD